MKSWMMLVTGPDAEIGQNLRRRIVAAAVNDFDEAFAVAREVVPWPCRSSPTDGG